MKLDHIFVIDIVEIEKFLGMAQKSTLIRALKTPSIK